LKFHTSVTYLKKYEKLSLLAVTALTSSLVSCKKDRTCSCTKTTTAFTETNNGQITTSIGPFSKKTIDTKIKRVSKKSASANCVSSEETVNYKNGSGNYVYTEVFKLDCKLKQSIIKSKSYPYCKNSFC
jgi:type 1 fimbria pilin